MKVIIVNAVTAFQRYFGYGTWVFGGHSAYNAATRIGQLDLSWLESLILNKQEEFANYICDTAGECEHHQCLINLGGITQPNEHGGEL